MSVRLPDHNGSPFVEGDSHELPSRYCQVVDSLEQRQACWAEGAAIKLKEIWAIRTRLQLAGKARDLALFNLAIDSKVRGCDLVSLRVMDVVRGRAVLPRAMVMQHKTHRPVQLEITEQTRQTVAAWIETAHLTSGNISSRAG